jgi:apolipoprotein N-acyltransferase
LLPPRKYVTVAPAVVLLAIAIAYGHWRLEQSASTNSATTRQRTVRIALIQGNSLADWRFDAAKQREIMDEYVGLSRDALAKAKETGDGRPPDLIVWPETTFRTGLREVDANLRWPADATQTPAEYVAAGPRDLASLVELLKTPVLVGTDRLHLIADPAASADEPRFQAYNSSALVDRDGKIMGTYDKSHLVMFGEYIPFAKWFPNLYRLSPITAGTEEGDGPKALCIGGVCYSPNICYETAIPHVIRNQVATLTAEGHRPDVLVNITNDAWYWGSSELDMHLACSVFRAVETRIPLVVAANGGVSAWIDAEGLIRAQSPRQKPDVIIADVELNANSGPTAYVATGDWFAGACLLCVIAVVLINWYRSRLRR